MNYRHAFHAGNFADVVKHAVLSLIIDHLLKKDAAFFALDTHAGIGRYDFWTLAPNKTEEYKNGIGRIWLDESAPEALAPYLRLVRGMNGAHLRHYPGSPYLLRQMMRPQDRLVLAEKHPDDAQSLKTLFQGDKQTAVHLADGWQSLKAFLPPKEKRGLVLIDPAFEEGGEYERLAKALIGAYRRWPQGILVGWHPIKDEDSVQALYANLRESEISGILAIRHLVRTPSDAKVLNGAGLVVLNTPYRLDETLQPALNWLAAKLAQDDGATAALDWISKDV